MKMIGLFLGCTTRTTDTLKSAFDKFMKKTGIQYEYIGPKSCCGTPLILSGLTKDFKNNTEKINKEIKESGIKTLIVSCPYCYVFLMMDYLPHLYIEIAKEKIRMQALPLNIDVIATACPSCYCNLFEASKEFDNIEVNHILEIVIKTMK